MTSADVHVLSLDLEPRHDVPVFHAPHWLPDGVSREVVKAVDGPIPTSAADYSHVIVSGSSLSILEPHPFIAPTSALVIDAVGRGVPVLGICYGHQLVVKALVGDAHVRRSPEPEMGWLPVTPRPGFEAHYAGLPQPFHTFVSHYDEVCDLPGDWQVTASSAGCEIQGFLNERLRVVGYQFHPEMSPEIGNACFRADQADLEAKGIDVEGIIRDTRDDGAGAVLIPRFLELFSARVG